MICPHCGTIHESERGKCPLCGADFHGHVREKHVVQPRDLVVKYRCAHGILRHQPCSKCGRSAEECEDYRRHILADLKELLITYGVSKSEAWERSKVFLIAIEASAGQEGK